MTAITAPRRASCIEDARSVLLSGVDELRVAVDADLESAAADLAVGPALLTAVAGMTADRLAAHLPAGADSGIQPPGHACAGLLTRRGPRRSSTASSRRPALPAVGPRPITDPVCVSNWYYPIPVNAARCNRSRPLVTCWPVCCATSAWTPGSARCRANTARAGSASTPAVSARSSAPRVGGCGARCCWAAASSSPTQTRSARS